MSTIVTTTIQEDTTKRIETLQEIVHNKPKNARAIAELALHLYDHNCEQEDDNLKTPLELAKQATKVQPQKPFGYVALSRISKNHEERMEALEKAIQYCNSDDLLAKIDLLVRSFIEPRRHEEQQEKSCKKKIRNRGLDTSEKSIYSDICSSFEQMEKSMTSQKILVSKEQQARIGTLHYSLGSFFRKMLPSDTYQPISTHHFQLVPSTHAKYTTSQFWLSTMASEGDEDQQVLTRCPEEYVVGLYSTFANNFDELLVKKLKYQTPTVLRQLLNDTLQRLEGVEGEDSKGIAKNKYHTIADLGCGTGLSGRAFHDCLVCDSDNKNTCGLVGVDLSPEMIEKAKECQIYHDLTVGDVTSILKPDSKFDLFELIISCDVFVYIGDLEDIFSRVSKSLSDSGLFCFSTELLDEDASTCPFKLHECARFAHKESYLRDIVKQAGMKLLAHKISKLRKNGGNDVIGQLVICRKL